MDSRGGGGAQVRVGCCWVGGCWDDAEGLFDGLLVGWMRVMGDGGWSYHLCCGMACVKPGYQGGVVQSACVKWCLVVRECSEAVLLNEADGSGRKRRCWSMKMKVSSHQPFTSRRCTRSFLRRRQAMTARLLHLHFCHGLHFRHTLGLSDIYKHLFS